MHLSIWARPDDVQPGPTVVVHDAPLSTLLVSGEQLQTPMGVTFEAAAECLTSVSNLYFEPDGSFLWVARDRARPWELAGVLYDQGETLAYAEIRGGCPRDEMERVLNALGHPEMAVVVQFVREGVFVAPSELLRFCAIKHPSPPQ